MLSLRVDVITLDGERTTLAARNLHIVSPPPAEEVSSEVRALAARVSAVQEPADEEPPEPLRLLVITHQLDLGGGQLYTYELLRHLMSELDMTCLVISATDGILRPKLEAMGAEVHVCGRPSTKSPIEYEELLVELAKIVREHRSNAAFVNTMTCAFGADLAARLEIPFVWAVHESYPLDQFFLAAYGEGGIDPYIRRRAGAALASAAAVVFEADATRRLYEVHGDPRRFITIPYGVPLGDLEEHRIRVNRQELRRFHDIAEHETVIVCVGTYEQRKGQGSLAVAFAEVADDFPDAVLVMIGDTGTPYATAVRQVVDRLKLGERVRLLPVIEDVDDWYVMADAFITVSDIESLPRSLLEVMAVGVPVVAVDVFGIGELLTDGVTGLLCEPRDTGAIVNGLRRILTASAEERAGLGKAGADLAMARFDSSGYAAAYDRLLRGLVERPDPLPMELQA